MHTCTCTCTCTWWQRPSCPSLQVEARYTYYGYPYYIGGGAHPRQGLQARGAAPAVERSRGAHDVAPARGRAHRAHRALPRRAPREAGCAHGAGQPGGAQGRALPVRGREHRRGLHGVARPRLRRPAGVGHAAPAVELPDRLGRGAAHQGHGRNRRALLLAHRPR
eukprot:scaffold113632_cov54-Phaeocystis_antarctica.AAC.2